MKFDQILLTLPSFVETHLFFYLKDHFSFLQNGADFILHKKIDVNVPFSNKTTRKNDISQIKPEFYLVNSKIGIVAEAAAWDDDSYANKQSESHHAMHKIGLPPDSVYFAQKIMCQVFPAYLYCKQDKRKVYSFISATENHITKMVNVLDHLKRESFLDSYSRPLGKTSCDVKNYYQAIFKITFPGKTDEIIKKFYDLGK
jgi:hypothetical protein